MPWTEMIRRYALSMIVLLLSVQLSYSQCVPPTLVQISAATPQSVSISWIYFQTVDGWEMELVPAGESPTLEPTTPIVTEKMYTFSDLDPASAYRVFIRTVCGEDRSQWNPVDIRTQIPQPSPCLFSLPIKNNNCNQGLESFDILVENISGILGEDLFLASVELIAEHTWPADLDIRLEGPSGEQIRLSQNNGTVTDDYGDISSEDCSQTVVFSDLACTAITDGHPPFIGTFIPEDPLSELENNESVNGVWKLKICDRSSQDIGSLKFIQLNFDPLICDIPRDIIVKSIDATKVEVTWTDFEGCSITEIELSLAGDAPGSLTTYSVPCTDKTFTIEGLDPSTDYDIYVLSNCLGGDKSPLSCPFPFTTACTDVTNRETFDNQTTCTPGCAFECDISGLWANTVTDDQDWIVWDENTNTEDTGPRTGAFGGGQFIYIEASPDICAPEATAILESSCILIASNAEECDFSFWYHMYGNDIGSLTVTIQANESMAIDTLFHKEGDQGNQWLNEILSLKNYDGKAAIIHFIAKTTSGTNGDIALDQIELRGSTFIPEGFTYYQDLDLDGYGNEEFPITLCSTSPPPALVANTLDCDDTDMAINPDAMEIPCNSIDENCNGPEDDNPQGEPLLYEYNTTDDLCSDPSSGGITLMLEGGNPPFSFLWSNGAITKDLSNVPYGEYSCAITDATLCTITTEVITVSRRSEITVNILEMNTPSCFGQEDGAIRVEATEGIAPYTYSWSDGAVTDWNQNISAGTYFVIATDANGCLSDTFFIDLQAEGNIEGDISFQIDVRCHGVSDGVLRADAISGVGPFTYEWSNMAADQQISNLAAGNYTCTISDSQGCQAIVEAILAEPDSLQSIIVSQENVLCFGESTGSIITQVTGGVGPYTYAWTHGQVTDDIFDLRADTYQMTVTDANACTAITEEVIITQPPLFSAEIDSAVFAKCILSENGYISVKASGGSPSYNYFWGDNNSGSPVLENIFPGTYSLTITDQNNCKTTINNYLLEADNIPIDIELTVLNENKCFDDNEVEITAMISDATAPIDYNWSNGNQQVSEEFSDSIKNLPKGTYSLTVTDVEGCLGYSDTIVVDSGDPISFTIEEKLDNICFEDLNGSITISASGGLSPYAYEWNNGDQEATIENLATGLYQVTITDENECTMVTQNISINSTPELVVNPSATPVSPQGNDGVIMLDIAGGTSPYSILWPDNIAPPNSPTASELAMGNYMVTVSDANDCDTILDIFVDFFSSTSPLKNNFTISPNPFDNLITIEPKVATSSYTIRLMHINGQDVPLNNIVQTPHSISIDELSHIPSGIYLLIINDGEHKHIKKVVKI